MDATLKAMINDQVKELRKMQKEVLLCGAASWALVEMLGYAADRIESLAAQVEEMGRKENRGEHDIGSSERIKGV